MWKIFGRIIQAIQAMCEDPSVGEELHVTPWSQKRSRVCTRVRAYAYDCTHPLNTLCPSCAQERFFSNVRMETIQLVVPSFMFFSISAAFDPTKASTTFAANAPSAAEKWTPAPSIAKPSAAPQVGHASKLQRCSRSRCPRSPPGSIMSLANDKAMCVGETKGLKLMP